MDNYLKLQIPALSKNEAFARNALAAFVLDLSPTVEEINDLKTAVSEAVTNSVVHAYDGDGVIEIAAEIDEKTLFVSISDFGKGIADVNQAREPFFTTKEDKEHSGMGFTIMETFMDELEIISSEGNGTTISMKKTFGEKC